MHAVAKDSDSQDINARSQTRASFSLREECIVAAYGVSIFLTLTRKGMAYAHINLSGRSPEMRNLQNGLLLSTLNMINRRDIPATVAATALRGDLRLAVQTETDELTWVVYAEMGRSAQAVRSCLSPVSSSCPLAIQRNPEV